ncbi:MAG: CopG family transcriptional regulator [Candidatus Aminicenantes bacterium]|nr:MAG: CopG family transcriptional regulator [Candidatus Aminicenantes bacterium]
MSKTITLRVSEDHYEAFRQYAKKENRKVSNAIETLALKQLESAQFVDGLEMEGILADRDLIARIGAGAKQAKAKKGRFVE